MNAAKQLLFVLFIVLFRTTLSQIIPSFNIICIGLILLLSIINIAFKINNNELKINKSFSLFILFLIFQLGVFKFSQPNLTIKIAILGILQYLVSPLYWFSLFYRFQNSSEIIFENFIKFLIYFSIIITIGAIIQFYFSSTLFGLIQTNIDDDVFLYRDDIAKRAISFIASPQNLGIFLGVSTSLIWTDFKKLTKSKTLFLIISFLLIFAGVLNGSKAFYIYLLTFFILQIFLKGNIKILYLIIPIIFFLPLYFPSLYNSETIQRILLVFDSNFFTEVGVVTIWIWFISDVDTILEILIGNGIGLLSSTAQQSYNYQIFLGSAESFILQVYYEIGIIGLIIWVKMYFLAIRKLYNNLKYSNYALILISFITNILFTPSFYGITISFIINAFIIFSLTYKPISLNYKTRI